MPRGGKSSLRSESYPTKSSSSKTPSKISPAYSSPTNYSTTKSSNNKSYTTTSSPSMKSRSPDLVKVSPSQIRNEIELAKQNGEDFYIGYARKEGNYMKNSGPKAEGFKNRFVQNNGFYTGVTENCNEEGLVGEHLGDYHCLNRKRGTKTDEGFVYLKTGNVKDEITGSSGELQWGQHASWDCDLTDMFQQLQLASPAQSSQRGVGRFQNP